MSPAYAVLVGILVAVAVFFLLRDSIVDHVFGLIVLGHAANLLVLGAGMLRRGAAPVLEDGGTVSDPLPQALVLTAIVIGFGVVAYATVLVSRLTRTNRTDDASALSAEDRDEP